MQGTIYKRTHRRKDGTQSLLYYAVISNFTTDGGTRTREWGHGYRTKREATESLNDRLARRQPLTRSGAAGMRLGSYLRDFWLPSMTDRIEPTTYVCYEKAINRVIPRLGKMELADLTPGYIHDLYRDLREQGGCYQDPARVGEQRPLSTSTVRAVHVVLSKALGDAVDLGLLLHNPAKRAKPPRVRPVSAASTWTTEELSRFLDFVADDPLYPVWRLATCTGLRRGELMGLRWCDIDVDAQTLAVRHARTLVRRTVVTTTPKSGHARVVNVDADTIAALAAIRPHGTPDDLVVRAPDGQPMHPDRLSQLFHKLVRHAGLRCIRLHDLRHTHASLLIAAGVPVKVVSERLGHADPAFTMRVYQHVLPGMQAEAANAFAALVGRAGGRGSETP